MRTATMETMVTTTPDGIEVAGWVRLARAGDRAAYERLYRTHVGRVYALCVRLSGSRAQANELTQDAFVHAWQKLSLLESDAAFASWLYRLTVNIVLMTLRRQKKWSAREAGSDVLDAIEPVRGRRDDGGASRVDLERAIAALPAQARVVFVLHDVEGYRHEEIANQMSIAVGTSKAQLHRARRLLREVLDR
jgi:RNA polymerase sigma-70 factor (ECF subfamily)